MHGVRRHRKNRLKTGRRLTVVTNKQSSQAVKKTFSQVSALSLSMTENRRPEVAGVDATPTVLQFLVGARHQAGSFRSQTAGCNGVQQGGRYEKGRIVVVITPLPLYVSIAQPTRSQGHTGTVVQRQRHRRHVPTGI